MSEEQTIEQPAEAVEAAQTTEQPVASWVDVEGKFVEGFREKLPDGLGEHSFLDKFSNVPDMIKWGVNAEKLIGKKAIEVWESEDPEIAQRRLEIMGVPKEASEYEYDPVELPEGMPVEQINARVDQFKDKAKELGLSKNQVKELLEWDMGGAVETFTSMQEAQQSAMQEAEGALRKEWKGDKYEYNVAKVGEALDFLGLENFKTNPAIANDPAIVKSLFEKIVPLISNDTLVEARQTENHASMEDRLSQLEIDMLNYDGGRTDPKYTTMMKEREQLLERFKN